MELRALVTEPFLAGAKGAEVLGRFRSDVIVEEEIDSAFLFCSWKLANKLLTGEIIFFLSLCWLAERKNFGFGVWFAWFRPKKEWCKTTTQQEMGKLLLTFDLARRWAQDRAFPRDIEVGLDGHDCGWCVEVFGEWWCEWRELRGKRVWWEESGESGAGEGHWERITCLVVGQVFSLVMRLMRYDTYWFALISFTQLEDRALSQD